jgi:hypothetical protein
MSNRRKEVNKMTDSQVNEAIEQMKSHTRHSVELNKRGIGEYEFMSARGVLHTLGYDGEDVDQVLKAIAARGFDYCLDPHISSHPGDGDPFYPSADGCHWGADQLLSRLNSLRSS